MSGRRRVLILGLLCVVIAGSYEALNRWVYQALTPPLLSVMEPATGVGSLSAETCASCHVAIASEWRLTGHAKATTDPLYVADLEAQGAPYFCDHCHAPLVAQREITTSGLWSIWPDLTPRTTPNEGHIAGLRHEGVTCVACHQRDGAMLGPFATALAPHPVTVSESLGTEATCRPCHSFDLQALGTLDRPLMDTFSEWQAYRAAGGDKNCVDCHMPAIADRPAARGGSPRPGHSHALRGPFELAFVREGAQVEGVALTATVATGAEARVTLVNGTGHRMPTAEPHRALHVALEAIDDQGAVLAQDLQILQRIVDLHTLTEIPGSDTSLLPRERRPLTLSLPGALPASTVSVRLVVRFILWSPEDAVAQAAGMTAEDLVMTLHEHRIAVQRRPGGGP
jgi:mono/diheme cytochrome c family protein